MFLVDIYRRFYRLYKNIYELCFDLMTNVQSTCTPLKYNPRKLFVLLSLTRINHFYLLVRSHSLPPDDDYFTVCGHRDRRQTCKWVRIGGKNYKELRAQRPSRPPVVVNVNASVAVSRISS